MNHVKTQILPNFYQKSTLVHSANDLSYSMVLIITNIKLRNLLVILLLFVLIKGDISVQVSAPYYIIFSRYIADADLQNILEPPTDGEYLCTDPISTYYMFSSYDSISTWYKIDNTKRLDTLREI